MAIKTSTFGGWMLTGEDAEAFTKQINDSKPNELAQTSYERGQKLLDECRRKGYVKVHPNKKSHLENMELEMETAELLSMPGFKQSIQRSLHQMENGETFSIRDIFGDEDK